MLQYVLVVEDDPDQRAVLQDLIRLSGYQVSTASNGQEALDLLLSGAIPAIIVLDITMPIMSGRELLQIICSGEHPELENIPVIVMSGVVDHAQLECVNCVALLRKPASIDVILSYVRQYTIDKY